MDASTEPQTLEEAATLREVAVTHRRRHRWVALVFSVCVSVHTTIILHTLWHGCPLYEGSLRQVVGIMMGALGSLGPLGWSLRDLRADEALDRQETLRKVRWRAQDRAWD
jgi:hypothetical protein